MALLQKIDIKAFLAKEQEKKSQSEVKKPRFARENRHAVKYDRELFDLEVYRAIQMCGIHGGNVKKVAMTLKRENCIETEHNRRVQCSFLSLKEKGLISVLDWGVNMHAQLKTDAKELAEKELAAANEEFTRVMKRLERAERNASYFGLSNDATPIETSGESEDFDSNKEDFDDSDFSDLESDLAVE